MEHLDGSVADAALRICCSVFQPPLEAVKVVPMATVGERPYFGVESNFLHTDRTCLHSFLPLLVALDELHSPASSSPDLLIRSHRHTSAHEGFDCILLSIPVASARSGGLPRRRLFNHIHPIVGLHSVHDVIVTSSGHGVVRPMVRRKSRIGSSERDAVDANGGVGSEGVASRSQPRKHSSRFLAVHRKR